MCLEYLGMENGDIPDANIQASSVWSSSQPAHNGRLNKASGHGWLGGWGDNQPWIQADIGYQTYVSGVATQGATDGWVTSFKVSTFYMTTTDEEIYVSEHGKMAKVNIIDLLQFKLFPVNSKH